MSLPNQAVVVRGDYAQALACGRSLKLIGDQTPRYYLGAPSNGEWQSCFLGIVSDVSEVMADQILVLDVPMLAFKRLRPIFEAGVDSLIRRQEGYAGVAEPNLALIENTDEGRKALVSGEVGNRPFERHLQFLVNAPGNKSIDVKRNHCEVLINADGYHLVRPHLWSAKDVRDAIYRRECKKLAQLSVIEAKMTRGQIAPLLKTRRSLEKRILKLMGKL